MAAASENRHGAFHAGRANNNDDNDDAPVRIPITGDLDLHTFLPRETAQVIDAYIEACLQKGLHSIRIIHGKGTGALRETVHAHLQRHLCVSSFRLGDENSGGWGATIARLRANPETGKHTNKCDH